MRIFIQMKLQLMLLCLGSLLLSFCSGTEYKVIAASKEKRLPGTRQGQVFDEYKVLLKPKRNTGVLNPEQVWLEGMNYTFKDSLHKPLFFYQENTDLYLIFTSNMLVPDSAHQHSHKDDLIIFYRSQGRKKMQSIRIEHLKRLEKNIPN